MISEKLVERVIDQIVRARGHLLNRGPATVDVNAPVALMQVGSTAQLDVLYALLRKERPRFKCDDRRMVNR